MIDPRDFDFQNPQLPVSEKNVTNKIWYILIPLAMLAFSLVAFQNISKLYEERKQP